MRKLLRWFKFKKIEIFLIIGFVISSYSFSMLIGYCSNSASKIIEKNKFNKQHKEVNITINNEEELESINDIVDIVYDAGIKNFTSKYVINHQEPVRKGQEYVLRNEVLGAYGEFNIEKYCEIEGRNFSSEELISNDKVAIIGERVNEYTYEIDNEKYINLFNDDYKVIGVLKNTKNFDRTTIVPFKSFNFSNNKYQNFGLYIEKNEWGKIEELYNEKYYVESAKLPTKSVILYLYENEDVFRECIFQLILSLVNLILFSIFISNGIKKDAAIMRVLGCTNRDVFKEIFKRNFKITTVGNIIGIILFEMSSKVIDVIFASKMSEDFIINAIITSIICYFISILISTVTLRNVIKFKVVKEIR